MQAYHTLVTGSSGGGKTTYLRKMHDQYQGVSIFLTTKRGERKARSDPPLRVRKSLCSYPEDIQKAREWAYKRSESVQIIVDEAQNSQLSKSKGPLKKGLHEDRDQGIKWVPATQSPQDLKESRGYPGINQCRYIVWCGPAKTFHSGFIDYYSLDDIPGGLPEQNYEFVEIEPTRPPKLLRRGMTDKKYG